MFTKKNILPFTTAIRLLLDWYCKGENVAKTLGGDMFFIRVGMCNVPLIAFLSVFFA